MATYMTCVRCGRTGTGNYIETSPWNFIPLKFQNENDQRRPVLCKKCFRKWMDEIIPTLESWCGRPLPDKVDEALEKFCYEADNQKWEELPYEGENIERGNGLP